MKFHKPVIAMEISCDLVRLALAERKGLKLTTLQAYELGAGIIEEGRPVRTWEIQNALADFVRAHSLPEGTKILLLLKNPLAMFRFADLPKLPEKELDKLVKLNYRDYLSVDVKDYRMDYRILRNTGTDVKAVFAAFPRDVLEIYVKLFKELGLALVLIDLYQNCIAEYFGSLHRAAILVVSSYGSRMSVVFIESGCLQGVKDLRVHDEAQLKEDIGKLPGYFVYAHIDTIYFMEEGHEYSLWEEAFPQCSFVCVKETYCTLDSLARRYYNDSHH